MSAATQPRFRAAVLRERFLGIPIWFATSSSIVLVVLISFVTNGQLWGQDEDPPPLFDFVPSVDVAVLGDSLLTGSSQAPLDPGACQVSLNNPLEQASASAGANVAPVFGACRGAELSEVAGAQTNSLNDQFELVILGGAAVEFDWPALSAACLSAASRNPVDCQNESVSARTSAANSFFLWRSALSRAVEKSPDAKVLVVGSPVPVSTRPLPLGSSCCGEQVDGHLLVRSVFQTAEDAQTAAIDNVALDNVERISTRQLFAGHELDSGSPWLTTGTANGELTPSPAGNAALASLLQAHIPEAQVVEAPARAPFQVDLITGPTSLGQPGRDLLAEASTDWFTTITETSSSLTFNHVSIATTPSVTAVNTAADLAPVIAAPISPPPGNPLAWLTAAVDTVAALTPGEQDRHTIISADDLGAHDLDPDELNDLRAALAGLGHPVSFVITDEQASERAHEIADGTSAAVLLLETSTALATNLPSPDVERAVIPTLARPSYEMTPGVATRLEVNLFLNEPVEGSIEWSINGASVGSGQHVAIDPATYDMPAGSHRLEVEITSTTTSDLLEASLFISADGDGLVDDLCPQHFDPDSGDIDGDSIGDVCDPNDDGDEFPDVIDPCPTVTDRRFLDGDHDGLPDLCDGDNLDGRGADVDLDGVPDVFDNCLLVSNSTQADRDADNLGDACDPNPNITNNRPPCTITGTAGNDRLVGTSRNDVICGLGGNDVLIGSSGDDILIGGPGNDRLRGGPGDDQLVGGAGDDRIFGGLGDDVATGADGNDHIEGNGGNDNLSGGTGADTIAGHGGADLILGGVGSDRITGDSGDDIIVGDRGTDTISGGDGNDHIDGGGGRDILDGGLGNDRFVDLRDNDDLRVSAGADIGRGA